MEQIFPPPWGLLKDTSEEREVFLPTLVRSNHAPVCPGPRNGPHLLDFRFDQALSLVPCRSQGAGSMSFLYHFHLQAKQHEITGLPPIIHPTCWQLCLPLRWLLAILPFLSSCGASSQPFSNPQEWWATVAACKPLPHTCLFCESAHKRWEPLWGN